MSSPAASIQTRSQNQPITVLAKAVACVMASKLLPSTHPALKGLSDAPTRRLMYLVTPIDSALRLLADRDLVRDRQLGISAEALRSILQEEPNLDDTVLRKAK